MSKTNVIRRLNDMGIGQKTLVSLGFGALEDLEDIGNADRKPYESEYNSSLKLMFTVKNGHEPASSG
jgi:hypothetical protein